MSNNSWLQWRGDSIGKEFKKRSQLQVGCVDVAPDGAHARVGNQEVDALQVRLLDLLRRILSPGIRVVWSSIRVVWSSVSYLYAAMAARNALRLAQRSAGMSQVSWAAARTRSSAGTAF